MILCIDTVIFLFPSLCFIELGAVAGLPAVPQALFPGDDPMDPPEVLLAPQAVNGLGPRLPPIKDPIWLLQSLSAMGSSSLRNGEHRGC